MFNSRACRFSRGFGAYQRPRYRDGVIAMARGLSDRGEGVGYHTRQVAGSDDVYVFGVGSVQG